MFTLRFQTQATPSSEPHQWHREGLTRADVERMGAVALRHGAVNIAATNPYGTDVTHIFEVFRNG
ncbi:hypothetical protein [Kitasatospora mediocidica]|uniref:hypothetical protein n=1 Tax=Kitasatospora mediocidica TaxID=58352 RepID=UPI000560B992|nr:hypothetical protein [Kitasatospora mediocidica]